MKFGNALARNTALHMGIIWALWGLVLFTDQYTPLGFAHGILYLPVVVYALSLPRASEWFRRAILIASVAGIAAAYSILPNNSGLDDVFIISNRLLSAIILLVIYAYFGKLRTVSQQYEEIQRLERSQSQLLTDFIEAMPVQVWSADARGEVVFASSSLAAFCGRTREAILEDWFSLIHPDDREPAIDAWSRSVETGTTYHSEFRLQRHDGKFIWFKSQAVPQRDRNGEILRWLGSSIDVDDLRQLRDQAEGLAAQFRLTVESITDAFFTLDHDFRFTYLNQNAAAIFGRSAESLLGTVVWQQSDIDFHSPFAEQFRRSAETQQRVLFEERLSPDGKWLEVRIYPSGDGLTVYFADITERMEMEERLRESQKLEAVGHLTGGVAHDFNNLLTVILGNAEIMAEKVADPKLRPMAEMIVSAAQRGAELTSRLLAFARRQPLDPKPTDVNQLVEAMQELLRRTLPESIDFKFVLDPDLGLIEIDAGELDSALLNLVVNARDAMKEGGKLVIETVNTLLDSDYAARHPEVVPGEYVMLCVSDTGAGMDPDTVTRAFEPFFTTKPVGKGSGLGLSMVFGFTKQSGGHIKIYSELGEGTSVKLYFPRLRAGQSQSFQPAVELRPQGGTEHILIVEDNDLVLKHLEGQLLLLGYRVTTAMSGPEALNALRANENVDLLLTDIVMPGGMNGRELAAQALAFRPSLRVLFTSGYTRNAIVHHGRLDPGVALLSKPYTRLELATKVREVLQGAME